jgi:hypothetical protein
MCGSLFLAEALRWLATPRSSKQAGVFAIMPTIKII